jgi:hypothetical protein
MAKRGNGTDPVDRVYEKDNIISIIRKTRKAIISQDTFLLKQLSDRTIHNATHFQDTDNIALAVMVYALAKITERERYAQYREWPAFEKAILTSLEKAANDLEADRIENFRQDMEGVKIAINKLSGRLRGYVEEVFRRAAISKASRIYEHGISLEQTANLLGVSAFELAQYAGQTGISDVNLALTMPIKDRLKQAEEFFK